MTLFDILKDVITVKSGKLTEESDFTKVFNKYMVVRWLSMDNRFVYLAEQLNMQVYHKVLSDEDFYRLLVKIVPKYRSHFIKYIKKPASKDTTAERPTEL